MYYARLGPVVRRPSAAQPRPEARLASMLHPDPRLEGLGRFERHEAGALLRASACSVAQYRVPWRYAGVYARSRMGRPAAPGRPRSLRPAASLFQMLGQRHQRAVVASPDAARRRGERSRPARRGHPRRVARRCNVPTRAEGAMGVSLPRGLRAASALSELSRGPLISSLTPRRPVVLNGSASGSHSYRRPSTARAHSRSRASAPARLMPLAAFARCVALS
jgi:hypothetical protein